MSGGLALPAVSSGLGGCGTWPAPRHCFPAAGGGAVRVVALCPSCPSSLLPPPAHRMNTGSQACACIRAEGWGGLPHLPFTLPA